MTRAPAPVVSVDVLLSPASWRRALAADTRRGLLAPEKTVSPVWFYDERGSLLFDEITRLPEYYLTRCELDLLTAHSAEIADVSRAASLVELGSGTSTKTRLLLHALVDQGTVWQYVPLDVSEPTLRSAAHTIARSYPGVEVHGIVGDFRAHLGALPPDGRRMIAFLGSTIGNLDTDERLRFLRHTREACQTGDSLLLSVDLVKDPARLVAAYDDARGVTADFNRNALHVLNRELGADFRAELFDHVAVWQPDTRRIEMRLRAQLDHDVRLPGLGITIHFERHEDFRTEISTKFTVGSIAAELQSVGFEVLRTWTDGDYALLLSTADD